MQHHDKFICPTSWTLCTEAEKDRFYEEIIFEIDPETHPLSGFWFDVVANKGDDVLVKIEDGEFDYAVITLTWSGKVEANGLPDIVLFISHEEWVERCMKEPA